MADEITPQPSGTTPAPPDLQQPIPSTADPSLVGTQPQPAAPKKETFGGGFRRGAQGEQYFVDAQGNVTNTRRTAESAKGTFGSILAGAVMGALAGAHSARPGGIPSHELSGGAGQGAAAASDYLQKRDERARGRAQQDFENRNVATEAKNKDLMYKAQIHIANLNEIKLAHEIGEAERNDPLRHQELVNATNLGSMEIDAKAKDLGLINERTYRDYSEVPKADIDKFNRHEVMLITQGDGSVKVWDRTFDPRTTPNANDYEVRDLMGLDAKGKPEWKIVGHVKAGASTAAQQEAELLKERQQTMAAAESNAKIAHEKAQTKQAEAGAAKDYSQVALNNAQIKLMQSLGVNVPAGYTPPPNLFKMTPTDAKNAIVASGVTVPPDFETMYAIGHYDADPKSLTTTPRKGMPTRDRNSAITYIRTFINPDWDEKNYDAVKGLEKEFASTRPGTAGGNLISFNAAVGHAGQLYQASQLLAQNNLTALNTMANAVGAATGKSAPKVYDGIRSVLVGEAGRLFKQAAPDVKEMEQISTALDRSSSPEQFKGVTQEFVNAFLTKGASQIWQFYNYTGKLPPSTFNPNTLKTMQDLGVDVSKAIPTNAKVSNTANQNLNQPKTEVNIPPAVAKVLADAAPGRHTLTDNSVWIKGTDGSITPEKAP